MADPSLTGPERTLMVEDVSHGGGLDEGRSVYFDARLDDGSHVRMVLPQTHISAFIARLIAFAGVAQKERDEAAGDDDVDVDGDDPGAAVEHTQMLAFQQIQISPLADFTGVAIQFQLQPGVNMVFPLQTRFLPQVSASLTKWHDSLQDMSRLAEQAGLPKLRN